MNFCFPLNTTALPDTADSDLKLEIVLMPTLRALATIKRSTCECTFPSRSPEMCILPDNTNSKR